MGWRPASRAKSPQVYFVLSGIYEVELSSGETRHFMPGDILLGEDMQGKGHKTRDGGDEGLLLATVDLST
jgi:hypothetical protein